MKLGFWIFSLVCALAIPAVMLIAGALFWQGGPQRINGWCGYRTRLSMRTKETWRFAHRYLARWWVPLGVLALAATVLVCVLTLHMENEEEAGTINLLLVIAQTALVILPIWPSERALRQNFDVYGCPSTPLGERLSAPQETHTPDRKEND